MARWRSGCSGTRSGTCELGRRGLGLVCWTLLPPPSATAYRTTLPLQLHAAGGWGWRGGAVGARASGAGTCPLGLAVAAPWSDFVVGACGCRASATQRNVKEIREMPLHSLYSFLLCCVAGAPVAALAHHKSSKQTECCAFFVFFRPGRPWGMPASACKILEACFEHRRKVATVTHLNRES